MYDTSVAPPRLTLLPGGRRPFGVWEAYAHVALMEAQVTFARRSLAKAVDAGVDEVPPEVSWELFVVQEELGELEEQLA